MALKPLNSVGGFSVGELSNLVIGANGHIFGSKANISGNLEVVDTATILNLRATNYLDANGDPIDFQQAQGPDKSIQFNDDGDFGGSANFTYDDSTQKLVVLGDAQFNNANLGNLLQANFAEIASNIIASNITSNSLITASAITGSGNASFTGEQVSITNDLQGNTATFSGDVVLPNLTVNLELSGNTAAFSGNASFDGDEVSIANDLQGNTATFSGNLRVANTIPEAGLFTDNLYYANGEPWDLQEAQGPEGALQFNQGDDFEGSANLLFVPGTEGADDSLLVSGLVDVTGNLEVSGAIDAGTLEVAGKAEFNDDADFDGDVDIVGELTGTDAVFTGNVEADLFTGNFSGSFTVDATDTQVLFSDDGVASGSANLTFDDKDEADSLFDVIGNVSANNFISSGVVSASGNISGANLVSSGKVQASGNVIGSNLRTAGSTLTDTLTVNNQATLSGDVNFANANSTVTIAGDLQGNSADFATLKATDFQFANGSSINFFEAAGANTQIQFNDEGDLGASSSFTFNKDTNVLNVSGNVVSQNADLGNLAIANHVTVASNTITNNLSVNLALSGNTASFSGNASFDGAEVSIANDLQGNTAAFSGNISALNADLGNLVEANFISVSSNVDAPVINTGKLANGTSNIRISQDGNVAVSIDGTANVVKVRDDQFTSIVDIKATGGKNIEASGNLIATGYVNAANATVTNTATIGAVITATVDAPTGNLKLSAAGANGSVELIPTGTGVVDVATSRITRVVAPTSPTDAASKAYVDEVAQGLKTRTAANILADEPLSADYDNGPENDGVGATLTATANGAFPEIDDVTLATVGSRVLVTAQANAAHNGLYVLDVVGDTNTPWQLRRCKECSTSLQIPGSFVFVKQGTEYEATGWVAIVDDPSTFVVGTNDINWTQFSGVGTFLAGDGIDIDGLLISAKVDEITTTFGAGGNIAVKAGADLTDPLLNNATFDSLDWSEEGSGAVSANTLSTIGDVAVGGSLDVDGILEVDGAIDSNSNISGTNFNASGNVIASADVVANNVSANTLLSAPTGNITTVNSTTGNITTVNATSINTVNANVTGPLSGNTASFSGNASFDGAEVSIANDLQGNTATFSGNVVVPNLAVNLALSGNTATFSGNISALNADLGNLATANFFTGTLINGTSNLVVAPSGNITLTSQGNSSFVVTDTGSNVFGDLDVTETLSANVVSANSVSAADNVAVGDTNVSWGTVTTEGITPETIMSFAVSGVTGTEFIIKGASSEGAKYLVATVTAVTDGTNADYAVYATAQIGEGSVLGTFEVEVDEGVLSLKVTPTTSNQTVWTAQVRTI